MTVCMVIAAGVIGLAALRWLWRANAAEERRWCEALDPIADDPDADVHCSYIGEPQEGGNWFTQNPESYITLPASRMADLDAARESAVTERLKAEAAQVAAERRLAEITSGLDLLCRQRDEAAVRRRVCDKLVKLAEGLREAAIVVVAFEESNSVKGGCGEER